jgi:endonuclease YncB( thermonuclease family)
VTARPGGALALLGALALGLAGCEAGVAADASGAEASQRAQSFVAQAAQVSAGAGFACTPVKLWDGDGPIHCAEGPRIRLSGIAARETDGSCSPGHPCPAASAEAAREALAALLGRTTGTAPQGHLLIEGPALTCRAFGSAGGNRTAAWCVSPTKGDLSCAMVKSGTVVKWDRYWGKHACG